MRKLRHAGHACDEAMAIELSCDLSDHERAHIVDAVVLHDRAAVGIGAPRPVELAARNGASLVAGLCGRIEQRRLYVDYLWVEPQHRDRGIGTRLLQAAERQAAAAGCDEARIETLAAPTCMLYVALGYQVTHRLDDYIPGLTLYVLAKRL